MPRRVAVTKAKGRRDEVVLEIKQGRLKAKLHVSRETWLPKSLESSGVSGPDTWTFADYREIRRPEGARDGDDRPGGPDGDVSRRVDSPAPAAPAGVYDFAATRPDDTQFNPEASPDVVVKRAKTGHILVRPKVDGQEIGWFIFDTGAAGTVIDPTAAAKLKLKRLGTTAVTSILAAMSRAQSSRQRRSRSGR